MRFEDYTRQDVGLNINVKPAVLVYGWMVEDNRPEPKSQNHSREAKKKNTVKVTENNA